MKLQILAALASILAMSSAHAGGLNEQITDAVTQAQAPTPRADTLRIKNDSNSPLFGAVQGDSCLAFHSGKFGIGPGEDKVITLPVDARVRCTGQPAMMTLYDQHNRLASLECRLSSSRRDAYCTLVQTLEAAQIESLPNTEGRLFLKIKH